MGRVIALGEQLYLKVVEAGLVVVQHEQRGGLEVDDLPTQLAADGTRCARHQHDLPGQQLTAHVRIQGDAFPGQQVLHGHVPDQRLALRPLHEGEEVWSDLDLRRGLLAQSHYLLDILPRDLIDGHYDGVHLMP